MKPKGIIIRILLIGLFIFYFIVDPEKVDFMLSCPLYKTTGYYCPGCGSQRAFHHLLHGNFMGALSNNFLFILAIIGLLYYIAILAINYFWNRKLKNIFTLKVVKIILLIIVLLFFIARNLPWNPFIKLAP